MAKSEKPVKHIGWEKCLEYDKQLKEVQEQSAELNLKIKKLRDQACAFHVVTAEHTLYPRKIARPKTKRPK